MNRIGPGRRLAARSAVSARGVRGVARRSARAGVEGAVRHHLRWVAARPSEAKYLFHCREPEVVSESDRAARQLNAAFYAGAGGWLAGHVSKGRIRALPPELCHALWMGPSLEYTRQWLAGSNRRGNQLTAERQLAGAAWNALRSGQRVLPAVRAGGA
jgi:hypothetical protein